MNLGALTKEELDRSLRELQGCPQRSGSSDELERTTQELKVHRIELEMQNRALRETQAGLEHSVHRYVDLYDNLPLAYITVHGSGQIVAANRAAMELLRRDKHSLIGAHFGRFMDPYDSGRLAAHLDQCMQGGGSSTLELCLRIEGVKPLPVQLTVRPAQLPAEQAPPIHIAITDVSNLKRSQRVLEEINQQQEEFNHSISHDLRGPIVTINTYAGIVLEEHSETMSAEGRGMMERIRAAASRMEETLKQLLEYSRLSRTDVVYEPVELQQVVADLLIEYRSVIQETKAVVQVDAPLPPLRGTRLLLSQVLGNLLSNALKYTAPGAAPEVRFSAEARNQNIVIRVADHGIGIDPQHHERVFRIFERLHSYSQYPGSGVGLAIVRRAVERMNGRIWIESQSGQGCCFCVELPKA